MLRSSTLFALFSLFFMVAPVAAFQQGQESDGDPEATTYAEVITEEAVTSEGLFDTHMIGADLYYEIPLDLMNREMLLLSRVSRTPDGAGYGGSKSNTSTVRWEHNGERVLLRLVSYDNFAGDSTTIAAAVSSQLLSIPSIIKGRCAMDLVPVEKTTSQYRKPDRDASIVGKTVRDAYFQQK